MHTRLFTSVLVLAAFTALLSPSPAADTKKKATPPAPAEKAPDPGKAPDSAKPADAPKPADSAKSVPFHGKVTAVDAGGKSFSIKGALKDRMFAVTDKTVVLGKDNQPTKAASIPMGEEVRGSATKSGDNWTAVKVFIGPKPPAADKAKPAEKTAEKPGEKTPAAKPTDPIKKSSATGPN